MLTSTSITGDRLPDTVRVTVCIDLGPWSQSWTRGQARKCRPILFNGVGTWQNGGGGGHIWRAQHRDASHAKVRSQISVGSMPRPKFWVSKWGGHKHIFAPPPLKSVGGHMPPPAPPPPLPTPVLLYSIGGPSCRSLVQRSQRSLTAGCQGPSWWCWLNLTPYP